MKRSTVWNRQHRLQTRIGMSVGVLIIVLAVGLAAVMARTAEKQVLLQSSANLEGLASQMSRELSGGMDRFAQAAVTQTYRDVFRNPHASAESMRTALDQFKQTNPEFAYVSIIDVRSAKVIAASGGIFEGGSGRGRPVFERGLAGPFVGDVHDAVRLAELLPKPENGEALRFLDVAAPVADPTGKVFRVFASHVAWQWTDEVRRDIFAPVKASSGMEAFLLDTEGKIVLAATPDLKVGTRLQEIAQSAGKPAAVQAWPGGGAYLTVVASTAPHGHFPGFGWKVVVRQPLAIAAAAASNLRLAFLVGALVLGLLGAAVAWLLTARLVRPVRLLAEAAVRAQSGAPLDTVAVSGLGAEVSAVQTAIAQLADTARLQTEASHMSQRQFGVLADSLPQVVFQAEAAGWLDYINQAWIGEAATAAGATGRFGLHDLERLIAADDRERFATAWQHSLATGENLKLRSRIHPRESAAARWFDIEARAVRNDAGETTKWVGTLFDVDDVMNRAERAQQALEQERAARLEAERIAAMKDEFLATVSHELRSPLSVITGWSDVLKRKGSDNPMVLKAAEVIRINARLQTALINDLLDITAVIAGKLTLDAEPLDLSLLGNEVLMSHLHAAQTKGVALVCRAPFPCFVKADRRRMTQVMSNLLGNACKFTEAGGRIELSVDTVEGAACLRVRDTGRGIAADFLPHVFERMRQEDASTTRRVGGLGLGLAIVQGLVRLHEGTVSVSSEGPGKGAVFTVMLPLLEGSVHAVPPDRHDDDETVVELQGRRVLLVDDEADAREVAQVALSSLGAEVRVASSGDEVLAILDHERFDVLVSDIGMPGMNGLSLIRQIRQRESGSDRHLPAVALTAFAMESDRVAGMQAGFQAYVAKPISLRRLSDAVARSIQTADAA